MLTIKNLYSGYNKIDIIKGINMEALRGEILAVIGPNGCGKTTLLRTLARLLQYRGEILLNKTDISLIPRKNLARKIALLAQIGGIYFPYTVYDTAAMGRYSHSTSFLKKLSLDDEKIIRQILEKLGLWEEKNRMIDELSGGQLQRVFLARTLIQDPEIILLDEPTNHLDLKHQIELLEYLSDWVKAGNRAVIAALHDLNLAHRYADNIVCLNNGTAVLNGKTKEVLSDQALNKIYGIDLITFMQESYINWSKT